MAGQEDAPMPQAARARGFCHGCSREVAAEEVEADEYACPLCREVGIVECPLEGFERWAGRWRAEYEHGEVVHFTVSEAGELSPAALAAAAGPLPTAPLQWAAAEAAAAPRAAGGVPDGGVAEEPRQQPFMFCARGHRPNTAEYFRLEADGSLSIRLISEGEGAVDGSVREGRAVRAPHVAEQVLHGPPDLNAILSNFMEAFSEGLQQGDGQHGGADFAGLAAAVDRGFQRLATGTAGLSEEQAQRLTRQGASVSQLFARLADGGDAPPWMMQPFAFDPAAFGVAFDAGGSRREQERSGVPESAARRFCEEHSIEHLPEGVEKGDEGWMCPICYLGPDAGDLVLLCEGDCQEGRNSHVFHQSCAINWLSRQNNCPFCRRTPVVPPLTTAAAHRSARPAAPAPPARAAAAQGAEATEVDEPAPMNH